jgi:hypothetical protein
MLKFFKSISDFIQKTITAVFLTIFYLMIFLPYSLLIKYFIKDSLDLKINSISSTYWLSKKDQNNLFRQF